MTKEKKEGVPYKRRTFLFSSFISSLPALPFLLIFGAFFLIPIGRLVYVSFLSNENTFTLGNFQTAFHKPYSLGLINSVKIGIYSAGVSVIPGALIAYFIETRGTERIRRTLSALNGVLANTGGVPLAFMFTAALGIQGFVTKVLLKLHVDLYGHRFSLGSFTGLLIVYLYFQLPLMIIVFSPAITSLRKEWTEAATNLGASPYQYWRNVGLPILFPSFVSSFLLLFASGFSAYATANALTVGNLPLTPLQIGGLLDGNVSAAQLNLGKALGVVMVLVSAVAVVPYLIIQRRISKWRQQ
jgi:putative spermidine/putrescine transport system permease protein